MAFASGSSGNNATMGDINVTPLVDVMLVLLIIFMVTTPMLSYQIGINLPIPAPDPPETADPIRLRIDGTGALYWDNHPLPASALVAALQVEATREPQPLLQLETSPEADYATLAGVLAKAKNAGMTNIGFVDPR